MSHLSSDVVKTIEKKYPKTTGRLRLYSNTRVLDMYDTWVKAGKPDDSYRPAPSGKQSEGDLKVPVWSFAGINKSDLLHGKSCFRVPMFWFVYVCSRNVCCVSTASKGGDSQSQKTGKDVVNVSDEEE